MNDRRCFETLDRSLQDLLDCQDKPFGGKSVLLGGDFRQTLPIVPGASKSGILASSLPRSYLWNNFKVYMLTENMQLQRPNISTSEQNLISTFSSWLVSVGDGNVGTPDISDPQDMKVIRIPAQYLIPYTDNALTELIHFIYDNDTLHTPDATTLSRKAIICPKNDVVHEINAMVINMAPGTATTYTSIDSVVPHPGDNTDIEVLYPVEYLNLLNFNGLPTHALELQVNSPVILLRNPNPRGGLCNGTRLIVTQLLPAIVEVQIMTGKFIGRRVYIPKISLTHKDKELPFEFKRKQFPLRLCYAMTINKSQGQSLDKIGIYLPNPVFTHGQLYVALSRAITPNSIKIVIVPHDNDDPATTKNIVYSDFLKEIDSTAN
ncbi:uncharacterized protein LOC143606610 [Bidens hawaiensis]|uniref:uncharacterized protein LOC143606610 n=1 Tax=Bidens hawaiensis TaxID=980011 RepID=UPI00404A0F26